MSFFFRKNEKINSEKEIELLFTSGKSCFIYPIKGLFIFSNIQSNDCKVLVTVSKRYLKNASDRNLVKRRLREAYRLNALSLKEALKEKKLGVRIALIYTSSKIIPFEKVEQIVVKHLMNILSIIEKNEKNC